MCGGATGPAAEAGAIPAGRFRALDGTAVAVVEVGRPAGGPAVPAVGAASPSGKKVAEKWPVPTIPKHLLFTSFYYNKHSYNSSRACFTLNHSL